jgi:hypothetical protein
MPHPRPRPPLPAEILAHPRRTAAWQTTGVSRQELRGPLWTPVLRGVHAWLPAEVTDPTTRIEAAISLMPTGAALGGWAALRWLGVTALDGRTGAGGSRLVPVSVCIGPVGRMRKRAGLDVDRSTLLHVDTTVHSGVRVTTPERSCLDVMRRLGAEEGLVAADATVRAGCTTRDQLATALTRLVGMPGVPQARLAVPLVDGATESGPESRLRYVWVVEAGLPVPLVNPTVVTLDGMFVGRTDLLDPEAGTVAEYDGGHHRDLTQHTADNAREEDLEHLNLTVTRSTALDLWPHRPRLVLRLRTAHRDGCRRDRSRDAWGIRLH